MSPKKVLCVIGVVLVVTASAQAIVVQAMVIPGRWEKVAAQKPGSKIIVSLMTGDRMECAFVSLSSDSMIVSTPDGEKREYRKDNVARITTADKRNDSLANGAGIGALVAGLPTGIIAIQCLARHTCTGEQAGSAWAIFVGIGAGIGLLVDAGIKDYETLYEAPPNTLNR